MDLFNRKRVRELEEACRKYAEQGSKDYYALIEAEHKLSEAQNKITYLLSTIRSMDDQIYRMGQMTDWPAMRKHFNDLHEQMTVRKRIESNRIGSIITNELNQKALT